MGINLIMSLQFVFLSIFLYINRSSGCSLQNRIARIFSLGFVSTTVFSWIQGGYKGSSFISAYERFSFGHCIASAGSLKSK